MNDDLFDDVIDEEITKESLRDEMVDFDYYGQLSMYLGLVLIAVSVLIPTVGYYGFVLDDITQLELILSAIASVAIFNSGLFMVLTSGYAAMGYDDNLTMYRLQMVYEKLSENEGDDL